ncbi:MAG: hypothetical protein AAFO06_20730 [Cyanobacteria bacterium J06597_16]
MDDSILAKQYALTGDIMDICNDPEWQKESARIEDDCNGYIEAGLPMRGYVEQLQSLTPEQNEQVRQYAKLIHILFPELHKWVESWNLGAGFEEAHKVARSILTERWNSFAIEQEEWVKALIAEEESTEKAADKTVRQQTSAELAQMFTDQDWQKIADGAAQAVKQNVLQVGQVNEIVESETVEAA